MTFNLNTKEERLKRSREALKSDLDLGWILLRKMNILGLSQNKLAKLATISTGLLSSIISGQRRLTYENALRLEHALKNVYAEELLILQMKKDLNR